MPRLVKASQDSAKQRWRTGTSWAAPRTTAVDSYVRFFRDVQNFNDGPRFQPVIGPELLHDLTAIDAGREDPMVASRGMKKPICHPLAAVCGALFLTGPAGATNPLILDQFTADPTVRVFDGRLYLYASHDIPVPAGSAARPNWFCMEDYHAFSSDNLTDWQDHGVILTQTGVPWANPAGYSMWAPDCVRKDGRYYFYFPTKPKEGDGFRIGVATSDSPTGPFTPEAAPIEGVNGIDPCVLLDKDGRAYLYFSEQKIFVAKLKDNLRELDGPVSTIDNLPTKGLLEGPFVFERHGIYYLTHPHVENKIERLEYATATSPLGPFTPAGIILDESASGCWTVHHSIVEFQGQWYLFYHDRDLSPGDDKRRSARADRLFFNDDGSIRKVVPTRRGVGLVGAQSRIQVDRYGAADPAGAAVSLLDPASPAGGWKVTLTAAASSLRFDEVDFGTGGLTEVSLRAVSVAGGTVEVQLDAGDGPLLARVEIGASAEWQVVRVPLANLPTGVHPLVVTRTAGSLVDLDWVSFN